MTQVTQVIPAGYKQTDLGVIPIDWEIKKLIELVEKERPISYGIVQTGKYINNGVKCIRVIDLKNGFINPNHLITTTQKISDSYKRTILKEGDLIIALRGKIGEVAIVEENLEGANLTRGIALLACTLQYSNIFLKQQLKSDSQKRLLINSLNGSALQEISISVLRKIPVVLPSSKAEQSAIATVLSDTDALIEHLEKLISKKKTIKQGTMQQLLTGKKRLPGFSGEWEYGSLEEVVQKKDYAIVDGPFGSQMKVSEFVNTGVPVIEMEHLNNTQSLGSISRFITNQKFETIKRSVTYPGDIVISKTGTLGLLGVVPVSISRAMITSRLAKISIDQQKANIGFVFHWLNKLKIDGYWERVSQGGTMQILGIRMLKEAQFPVIDLTEQTAIATLLSDMDSEIEKLEHKQEKYVMLKQGMMQVLLTGKIRLI